MASLLRNDGDIVVYAIKHVHPNTIALGWDGRSWENTGNCSQFARRDRNMDLYKPIQAGGETWQRYGVNATPDFEQAKAIAIDMAKNYPDYHFGVAMLHLTQRTAMKAIVKAVETQHA